MVLPPIFLPLADLPFESPDGRIWLRATVKGKPIAALLDTGASESVVDLPVAGRARRRGSRLFSGYGAESARGWRVEGMVARLVGSTIDIGLDHALSMAGFGPKERRPSAILGYDFLVWYVVEIDYARSRVRVYDRASYTAPPGYQAVPMPFVDRLPTVDGPLFAKGLEGRSLSMMLDTGSPSGVSLTYRTTKREKLEARYPDRGADGAMGGVGGARRVRPIGTVEGCLGALPFSAPGRLLVEGVSARRPSGLDYEYDAILGNEALRGFDLVFDYYRGKLYVRRKG